MIVKSNRAAIGGSAASLRFQASALADPLSDLLQQGNGAACYTRVYDKAHLDKHPGQKTTEVRLSLLRDELDGGGAIIRVMLKLRQAGELYRRRLHLGGKGQSRHQRPADNRGVQGTVGTELLCADQRGRFIGRGGRRFPDRPEDRQPDPALSAGHTSLHGRPSTDPAAPISWSSGRKTECSG